MRIEVKDSMALADHLANMENHVWQEESLLGQCEDLECRGTAPPQELTADVLLESTSVFGIKIYRWTAKWNSGWHEEGLAHFNRRIVVKDAKEYLKRKAAEYKVQQADDKRNSR